MSWTRVQAFVCSTFADMHAERDFLVKRVFPDLQEWCAEREIRLVDIDLRWGITDEAVMQGRNVVKRCLESIDESRPLFICFLGQRYGWVPRPEDVSPETYSAYPVLRECVGQLSVTEIEILHAVVSPLGSKATPALPRMRAFFYLREPTYLERLPAAPQYLRRIYTDDAEPDSETRRARLEALHTLKDRKINLPGCLVRHYRAAWRDDRGECTPEIALSLYCDSESEEQASRWRAIWKEAAGIEAYGASFDPDSVEGRAAVAYNHQLTRGRLSDFVCDTPGGSPAPLSDIILDDLKKAIQEELPSRLPAGDQDDLSRERVQQEEFVFGAALGFIERTDTFSEIDEYLMRPDDCRIFVLTGAPGAGKSSLLAAWVQRFELLEAPRPTLVYRFVGASDRLSSLHDLLRSVLLELNARHTRLGEEVPEEPELLLRRFPALLSDAARAVPVVLLVDAVNQLDPAARYLTWLPRPLPDNLKVVVSCPQWKLGPHEIVSQVRPFEA